MYDIDNYTTADPIQHRLLLLLHLLTLMPSFVSVLLTLHDHHQEEEDRFKDGSHETKKIVEHRSLQLLRHNDILNAISRRS